MYELLIIDESLSHKISNDLIDIFHKEKINFQIAKLENKIYSNTLFLTDNKDNISKKVASVFLLQKDYDFLDVKDAIFIKNIEDVVRIYNDSPWKKWAGELQFLAQNTLAYSRDKFDRERAERIRDIACEMLSYQFDIPLEKAKLNFAAEIGYNTPKVENRAAVIKDNKILLVKEQADGKWALPGGYQDVDYSIRENVIKEAGEEAGAIVNPKLLIAVQDYNKHHHVNFPFGMVKIFVLCDYINHSFEKNVETADADFFALDNLPELSLTRNTYEQIKMCFDCYYNQNTWQTIFE